MPIISEDEQESLTYPVVNGVMLVPVTDAHLFGLSASTIRRLFREGKLTKYDKRAQIKRGSGSQKTFWDPKEYFNS